MQSAGAEPNAEDSRRRRRSHDYLHHSGRPAPGANLPMTQERAERHRARKARRKVLIDAADTVSDIGDLKHAFRSGVRAQPGIDW